MNVKAHIMTADKGACQKVLAELLERYLEPAFSSLPKKEIDLLVLSALEELAFLSREPSLYELVTKLRVTRTKARNLIYDRELRRLDTEELDLRVKAALTMPLLQKQGELFVLEIENPLVIDHLRAKLQALGHASDGSFSPSLVRMTLDAVAALIEDYLSKPERTAIKKAMIKAGAPDSSFQGVLKSTIKAIAKKVAQDSGDALVEKASSYLAPIVDGAVEQLTSMLDGLFEQVHKTTAPVVRA